jgi:hypothetical protein
LNDPVLSVSIEPIWGTIRDVRDKVGVLLKGYPAGLRSAVMMTASELLENAVKYGYSIDRAPRILFSLSLGNGLIQIRTVNGSNQSHNVERLQSRLQLLATTEDPTALYLNSIQQMLAHPKENGGDGLGLYRVVAEGGFALSCQYAHGVVDVLATRSIA